MEINDVLADAFGRIRSVVHQAIDGLDADRLAYRIDPDANSIAWLAWHLVRIQDDHVAELAGREQAWTASRWHERFGMPADPSNTGFGHTSEQVAAVRPDGPDVLAGYLDEVTEATLEYVAGLDAAALDRIVDRSYDPPVSVGVRLVSVVSDGLQHAGQARYVRGVIERTV